MPQSLEDFVESVNGTSRLRVEQDFGDGFVRLRTSEAERRQAAQDIRCSEDIVLELLRNSRDAHAAHIFVAVSREGSKRLITVIDDGCGIPSPMHELVFEPRVTSKLDSSHMDAWGIHGRGMALYSISVNAQSAHVVSSETDIGCAIHVETNLDALPEKTDQSSFPTFLLDENNNVNVRGPKNILRTACEFAIESRSKCSVYIGSPAEIASTLYRYGLATLSVVDRLFPSMDEQVPLVKRLAQNGDPASLREGAEMLGLALSERTARRILDGEVNDLDPILNQIEIQAPNQGKSKHPKSRGAEMGKSIKLHKQDAEELADAIKVAYAELARRYYLEENVEPIVRSRKGQLVITVPLIEK